MNKLKFYDSQQNTEHNFCLLNLTNTYIFSTPLSKGQLTLCYNGGF